jgi:hypothetical protein
MGDKPWHDAVLHECIVRECCYVPDDPRQTLRNLLQWEATTALDPLVSGAAQELIERGRQIERKKSAWAAFLEARARLIHEWTGVKSDDRIAFDLSMDGPFQVKLIREGTKNAPMAGPGAAGEAGGPPRADDEGAGADGARGEFSRAAGAPDQCRADEKAN